MSFSLFSVIHSDGLNNGKSSCSTFIYENRRQTSQKHKKYQNKRRKNEAILIETFSQRKLNVFFILLFSLNQKYTHRMIIWHYTKNHVSNVYSSMYTIFVFHSFHSVVSVTVKKQEAFIFNVFHFGH